MIMLSTPPHYQGHCRVGLSFAVINRLKTCTSKRDIANTPPAHRNGNRLREETPNMRTSRYSFGKSIVQWEATKCSRGWVIKSAEETVYTEDLHHICLRSFDVLWLQKESRQVRNFESFHVTVSVVERTQGTRCSRFSITNDMFL